MVFELCVKILMPNHNDCCEECEGLSSTEKMGGGVNESLRSRQNTKQLHLSTFLPRVLQDTSLPSSSLANFLSACVHHSQQAHWAVKYKTLQWGGGMCVFGNFLHLSEVQGAGGPALPGCCCCSLLCTRKDVRVSEGSVKRWMGAGARQPIWRSGCSGPATRSIFRKRRHAQSVHIHI